MKEKEKYRNARAFVVLLAALITQLLNIKYERNLVEGLILLIIVIAVFYVIASIACRLIDKIKNMQTVKHIDLAPPTEAEEPENSEQ